MQIDDLAEMRRAGFLFALEEKLDVERRRRTLRFQSVERGENFVEPLKATDVFPHMVGQMVGVGEQTGALDAMLSKIADFYEQEVDAAIANLLSLMEPAMILFLGVTIGTIVIAMYLPLFTLIGKLAGGK